MLPFFLPISQVALHESKKKSIIFERKVIMFGPMSISCEKNDLLYFCYCAVLVWLLLLFLVAAGISVLF